AGLADDAERAALLDREVHAVHGADHAAVGVEAGAELGDGEERAHGCASAAARLRGALRLAAGAGSPGVGTAMWRSSWLSISFGSRNCSAARRSRCSSTICIMSRPRP